MLVFFWEEITIKIMPYNVPKISIFKPIYTFCSRVSLKPI